MNPFDETTELMERVQSQSRIIEAMMRAHELENQYRAQGYSEAQIQQFHESIMDKMKSGWDKGKEKLGFKKEEEKKGIMSRIGGGIKAAWNAVITWLKKIWYKMVNFFRSDETFLKKYEADLKKNASQFQDIKITYYKHSNLLRSSPYDISIYSANANYKANIDKVKDFYPESDWEETTIGKAGGVENIIKLFKTCGEMSDFKEAISKLEKSANKSADNAKDDDNKKYYLKWVKQVASAKIKFRAKLHNNLKQALIKCLAVMKKSSKNEAMMLIEQVEINSNYLVESLLLEGEQVDQIIAAGIGTQNGMGITDVNLAGQDLGAGSTDPNHLVYDDDLYSQDVEMGDENIAGTIDIDPFDTETHVASGNPVKAMESGMYEIIGMLNY